MDRSLTTTKPLGLPTPAMPIVHSLAPIFAASGPTFMALYEARQARLPEESLVPLVMQADGFLGQCVNCADRLRDAAEVASDDDITAALVRFVGAWPNASNGDLAAYGAQLAQDVIDRQPCRYALDEALRDLRQTSRFLPAIAEVLGAMDRAQTRVRNTVWHIEQLERLVAQTQPAEQTP